MWWRLEGRELRRDGPSKLRTLEAQWQVALQGLQLLGLSEQAGQGWGAAQDVAGQGQGWLDRGSLCVVLGAAVNSKGSEEHDVTLGSREGL